MNEEAAAPVVLITGGARRVGAVIARSLHRAGYRVVVHYRHSTDAACALVAELLKSRPNSALAVPADLADLDTLEPLIGQVIEHFGRLDALINNASAFFPTPIGAATPAQWHELFASNAQAPFFLSQVAVPALRERSGAIVNLVDIYAERALADHPIYVMAKAALVAMTRNLALDLAPAIRVNAIAPGAVLWPEDGDPGARADILKRTPLGRAGRPEDVASAALYLLRDAPYVTGQIIRVDGGRVLPV